MEDHLRCMRHSSTEDDVLVQRKAFEIPKSLLCLAYQDVHRNLQLQIVERGAIALTQVDKNQVAQQ